MVEVLGGRRFGRGGACAGMVEEMEGFSVYGGGGGDEAIFISVSKS